jgi:hypothetical protein
MQLLSTADVEFVGRLLDRTEASAAALEHVHGPAIVYDRAAMQRLATTAPADNISEWIDDQAALVMKWGVPILACTRTEWLDGVDADTMLISQAPVPDGDHQRLIRSRALAVFGRADAIDPVVAADLGITATDDRVDADFLVCHGDRPDVPPHDRPYLPTHTAVGVADDVLVHYESARSALITRRGSRLWWQPTDWSEPFNQFVPKYQIGSTYPAYRVATLLHELSCSTGQAHIVEPVRPQPVAFHAWRSGGVDHVLLGNLETGEFGDSRTPRRVTLRLPADQLVLGDDARRLELVDGHGAAIVALVACPDNAAFIEAAVELEPESAAVYRVIE